MRDRYIGQQDTFGTRRWTREIPYRTWREQLEERSTTGRDLFGKRSISLVRTLGSADSLLAFSWHPHEQGLRTWVRSKGKPTAAGSGATLVELLHSDTACLVLLQARAGGNALIGRELYPLLRSAGFEEVRVSPRMVYVDSSKPELVEGFTKKTFTAMVEGVRNSSVANGLISEADFDRGIADLHRTAEIDGVFCYTFFKAAGIKQRQRGAAK